MTKKLLISTVVLCAASVSSLSAQDSASYQKNYSRYLAAWERDLNRRSGIAVPEPQTTEEEVAQSDSPWAPPRCPRIEQERVDASSDNAVSVEAFYAMANEDLMKDFDELGKLDLCGMTIQYTLKDLFGSDSSSSVSPEFFVSAGLGYGDEEICWDEFEKEEISVLAGQFSVGGNLSWEISSSVDLFVGARLGLGYISVESEYADDEFSESRTESDWGVFYGLRLGTNIEFVENHALTIAADYWGSTARADFDGEKSKEQTYCVFSLGYRYSF